MKTNAENANDDLIRYLVHRPCATDERSVKSAGVSMAQPLFDGRDGSAPDRPKRSAPWLRAALLVLAVFEIPAALQAEDFRYIISDGYVTITAYVGPGGEVTIPAKIQGLPVTSLVQTFNRLSDLTGVTIPDSVTSIGENAFADYTRLASVKFPNSVTSIDTSAFSGCTSLTRIIVDAIESTATLGAEWREATPAAAGLATQKRVVLPRPTANGFYRLKLAATE